MPFSGCSEPNRFRHGAALWRFQSEWKSSAGETRPRLIAQAGGAKLMSFCGNCGTHIQEGESFCCNCGARVDGGNPAAQPSLPVEPAPSDDAVAQAASDASLRKLAALKAQMPSPEKSSDKKVLIAVLAIFLVGAIALAGFLYIGYRVKQKASAAVDNLEGRPSAHKVNSDASPGNSGKSKSKSDDDRSLDSDADNPLAAVFEKL